jgi:protease-4
MKHFFTSMLGALAALLIFSFGGLLLFAGLVGAIISLGNQRMASTESLEKGSYLVFDLSTNITDAPPAFDLGTLYAAGNGERNPSLQLRTVIRAIRAAAADPRIAGLLIKGSLEPAGYGSGYAALREVRLALVAFRASGKPVRAYLDQVGTRDYYLASAASDVVMDPYGAIEMPGLASESPYFAGLFQKYGVDIQVTREGRYKSAVEPLTRSDMSAESREETQVLLDEIWGSLLGDIGQSRGLDVAALQRTVDTEGLILAKEAKRARWVDRVADRDQLFEGIRAETGPGSGEESFRQISLPAYARIAADSAAGLGGHGTVAVVYAEGEIVNGDGGSGEVGGDKFAAELRKLRRDNSVKAIVLRVNSPGGSVVASEEIRREVVLARQAKPVVVSMGAYAASGGYWISADSNRIFAEPTTITGSIGVFGIQFDVQKLAENFGITFDRVKTGRFADADTIARPKTPEELAVAQRQVDWLYAEFVDKVAAGRKLPRAQVEAIAQGRVWSGAAAKRLGLVDEIGGLGRATEYAAREAGLGLDFRVLEYPGRKDLSQALQEFFARFSPDARAPADGFVGLIARRMESQFAALRAFNDPQGMYARLPLELQIR